jgi:hypothetical protein
METREQLEKEIELWNDYNPILVKQAKNKLKLINDQEEKEVHVEKVIVEEEITAPVEADEKFDVFEDEDVNKDGVVDEEDLEQVNEKISFDTPNTPIL